MLFMVIETFEKGDMVPIYKRFFEKGRGVPDGVTYVDSWIEASFARCFQIMECNDLRLMQQWVLHWRGTGTTFEVIPVVKASETRELITPFLGGT